MHEGLGAAIDLMDAKLTEKTIASLKGGQDNCPESIALNQLFDYKWCWQIGSLTVTDKFIVQGRLLLPGIGFRDGIGIGETPQEASQGAFTDAVGKLGFALSGYKADNTLSEVGKKSKFTDEQLEKLTTLKDLLDMKDNYELVRYLQMFDARLKNIKDLAADKIDKFIEFLERELVKKQEADELFEKTE